MNRSWKVVTLILGLALLVALPGSAQDIDQGEKQEKEDQTLSPYFFVENGDPAFDHLPLKETRADVHIARTAGRAPRWSRWS